MFLISPRNHRLRHDYSKQHHFDAAEVNRKHSLFSSGHIRMDCHPSASRDGGDACPNDIPDSPTMLEVFANGCWVGRFNSRDRKCSGMGEHEIEKHESWQHGRSETLYLYELREQDKSRSNAVNLIYAGKFAQLGLAKAPVHSRRHRIDSFVIDQTLATPSDPTLRH